MALPLGPKFSKAERARLPSKQDLFVPSETSAEHPEPAQPQQSGALSEMVFVGLLRAYLSLQEDTGHTARLHCPSYSGRTTVSIQQPPEPGPGDPLLPFCARSKFFKAEANLHTSYAKTQSIKDFLMWTAPTGVGISAPSVRQAPTPSPTVPETSLGTQWGNHCRSESVQAA